MSVKFRAIGTMLVFVLAFALVPAMAFAAQGVSGTITDATTGVGIPFARGSVITTGSTAFQFVANYDGTYFVSTGISSNETTLNATEVFARMAENGGSYDSSTTPRFKVATDTVVVTNIPLARTFAYYQPVYRFFNMKSRTHFYTASDAEFISVYKNLSKIYKYDGIAYSVPMGENIASTVPTFSPVIKNGNGRTSANTVPLYRFYNKKNGTHFYTASQAEMTNVKNNLSARYQYDGIGYYVALAEIDTMNWSGKWLVEGSMSNRAITRFYQPKRNAHFYSGDEKEIQNIVKEYLNEYNIEGTAFWTGSWIINNSHTNNKGCYSYGCHVIESID